MASVTTAHVASVVLEPPMRWWVWNRVLLTSREIGNNGTLVLFLFVEKKQKWTFSLPPPLSAVNNAGEDRRASFWWTEISPGGIKAFTEHKMTYFRSSIQLSSSTTNISVEVVRKFGVIICDQGSTPTNNSSAIDTFNFWFSACFIQHLLHVIFRRTSAVTARRTFGPLVIYTVFERPAPASKLAPNRLRGNHEAQPDQQHNNGISRFFSLQQSFGA
jgi:hypothetical protein